MVPKIDPKRFLLKRRLIEIRKFLREGRSLLADFPHLTWRDALRTWMIEHREEQARLRTELKDHLRRKAQRRRLALIRKKKQLQ